MNIPDGQVWMLHHVGTAYYWTRWLDAPLRDDRVVVMGLPCRVVAVVDDACGESKVFVERVLVDGSVRGRESLTELTDWVDAV